MPLLSTFGAASARSFGGIGAAAAGATLDIDEAFSAYLYEGTGSAQTITNGVDLSGEGGLVWIKNRDTANGHNLEDTERGAGKSIYSNTEDEQYNLTGTSGLSSFNSNGFSITGSQGRTNTNGDSYAAWTFRKAPKFFDVVTWTGDGATRNISHNLGSVPGMILIKRTDSASGWVVYHRSVGATKYLRINTNAAEASYSLYFNDTEPTSSVFTVGSNGDVNGSSNTYVAYLFAHNNSDGEFGPDSDQDIIKCGSFSTPSSGSVTVDLGFEPQWLLVKATNQTYSWEIYDVMRGLTVNGHKILTAQTSNAEGSDTTAGHTQPTSTGFSTTTDYWGSNVDFIYMAIRRGPLAEPTSATDVFTVVKGQAANTSSVPGFTANHVVDLGISTQTSSSSNVTGTRLLGDTFLSTDATDAETANPVTRTNGYQNGYFFTNGGADSTRLAWMWKRAPSYFDAVAYTGTGSGNLQISHNLNAVPEMMWVKIRSGATNDWIVYHKDLPTSGNSKKTLFLNLTSAGGYGNYFADASGVHVAPTSSVFTLGAEAAVNGSSSYNYIAYLFASVAGVSKVGSYTGNGSSQNIDCGFSGNARFVLIKNASQSDNWMVYDSVRGINSGTEGYLRLNSTAAEYTSGDHIDPYSGGFAPTSNDPSTNRTGNTYLFYAIA